MTNVLSLFAGIGGFELGLERAGMTIVGQVEIAPYCRRVLAKHWPEVPKHDDVRTAARWWSSQPRPHVDVVCGGFPCQDISSANVVGRGAGLAGRKSGLWSAFADVVESVRPRWVLVENGPEWRNWTPAVRSDLHELGYGTGALVLPAGALGAPHRRPRVFVVADAHGEGEPLRALHAQVARLRAVPVGSGRWTPGTRPVGVADGIPERMDRLRVLGNAVVPAVAELLGRLVLDELDDVAAVSA
jgi:DNA (cytosine-5)-methyltransferase 1